MHLKIMDFTNELPQMIDKNCKVIADSETCINLKIGINRHCIKSRRDLILIGVKLKLK